MLAEVVEEISQKKCYVIVKRKNLSRRISVDVFLITSGACGSELFKNFDWNWMSESLFSEV